PLLEAMKMACGLQLVGRSTAKLADFVALHESLSHLATGHALEDLIAEVLSKTGYLRALEQEDTPESQARLDNLRELLSSARDFHAANEDELEGEPRTELELYLDQVALISDLDGYEDREDRVSLMTVHSAKGLEFPTVFLVGLEERIFPHASSSRDEGGIEEERRLCYVAMTRAMQQLFLSCAAQRMQWGERSYQSPSRFLQEIPDAWIETLGKAARGPRTRMGSPRSGSSFDYSYAQDAAPDDAPGEGGVAVGTAVRHPVFGRGQVLAVIGTGLNQKLRIKF